MCEYKLYRYQTLSEKKDLLRFVLLITGYFINLYYTGQNRSGLNVVKSQERITLRVFEAFYAKLMLA